MKSYRQIKSTLLKDQRTQRAYTDLEPEFTLIKKLVEKRLKHQMSQASLAKKIGTRQSAISRFEAGSYHPTLTFLQKVADALDAKLTVTVL
jgi:ribosome-binding protein aMBF1 (putative translation factor)